MDKSELVRIATHNRHFLLYAKNHYKRTELWQDLRKLQAAYANVEPGLIGYSQVYERLVNLCGDLCGERVLRRILLELWKWKAVNALIGMESVVKDILVALADLQVKQRSDGIEFDLGEPDPSILELRPPEQGL